MSDVAKLISSIKDEIPSGWRKPVVAIFLSLIVVSVLTDIIRSLLGIMENSPAILVVDSIVIVVIAIFFASVGWLMWEIAKPLLKKIKVAKKVRLEIGVSQPNLLKPIAAIFLLFAVFSYGHYIFQKQLDVTKMNLVMEFSQTQNEDAKEIYTEAQYNLGLAYENGYGVEQDYQKAIEWYQKAAQQGLAKAQSNLGGMYANGHGVKQDYQKAIEWYQKAAQQGLAKAQYNLGLVYENGYGVTQDYEEAMFWYQKAADQGYALAQDALKKLTQNK